MRLPAVRCIENRSVSLDIFRRLRFFSACLQPLQFGGVNVLGGLPKWVLPSEGHRLDGFPRTDCPVEHTMVIFLVATEHEVGVNRTCECGGPAADVHDVFPGLVAFRLVMDRKTIFLQ